MAGSHNWQDLTETLRRLECVTFEQVDTGMRDGTLDFPADRGAPVENLRNALSGLFQCFRNDQQRLRQVLNRPEARWFEPQDRRSAASDSVRSKLRQIERRIERFGELRQMADRVRQPRQQGFRSMSLPQIFQLCIIVIDEALSTERHSGLFDDDPHPADDPEYYENETEKEKGLLEYLHRSEVNEFANRLPGWVSDVSTCLENLIFWATGVAGTDGRRATLRDLGKRAITWRFDDDTDNLINVWRTGTGSG